MDEKTFAAKLKALATYYDEDAPISKVVDSALIDLERLDIKADKEELIKFLYLHEIEIQDIKEKL